MRKIPTIFLRDWNGEIGSRTLVINKPNPAADWVFAGEGFATRKIDGTCCMIREGKLFKRRELKGKAVAPEGFIFEELDTETGKTFGWVPVGDGNEDVYHRYAFYVIPAEQWGDGTYELIGPKIQGNPEGWAEHALVPHWSHNLVYGFEDAPRTFDGLKAWLADKDVEGLVFHHLDGRMAKIKLRDFGLDRPK